MDSFESLVVGEEDCTFKDIVDVFFNQVNSVAVFRKWTDFAREVDIEPYLIEEWIRDILTKALTVKDVLHNILASWKSEKGKEATLNELLKHLEKVELKNVADDLQKLFSTENRFHKGGQQLFKPTLPKKPKYYIPRTLITRSVIDAKVFSSTHKDVFVVHEIRRHQLSQLAKTELTDTSTSQAGKPKLSVRFILLENFGDWALLCRKTTDPIHLLKHHDGRFHWICTNGDISELQIASEEKNQNMLNEEEFIEEIETDVQFQPNQPIFISDTPGMGKSLLLASIGSQLQQRYPQRCIGFIVISDFVAKIRELLRKTNNTENAVVEAIYQICENSSARQQLLQKMTTPIESPCTQIELMFDGFDEVSAENLELAHKCLKILNTKFNSATRIWVTTRPQHLQTIEKRFSVLGHNIQAFQDKHQIEFLTSFWKSQRTKLDDQKLQSFSKTCLNTLKEKLNKKDEDIAGIPLQCMLIAEVYIQDAHRFSDSKNERFNHCPEVASVVINSIADLYQKMIEHKIEKFKNTYPRVPENTKYIWHCLMYHALELIFPSYANTFKDILQIEAGLKPDYLVNIGILECSGSTTEDPARFIHKTFAEYLAARYFVTYEIVKNTADVENSGRGLPDFLFSHVFNTLKREENFHSFEHCVVCYFVDALLGSQTNMSTEKCINQATTSFIKSVIYASIRSDFGNIIKFLYSLKYPESFSIKSILYSDPDIFVYATRYTSFDLLKFLLDSFEHEPLIARTHSQTYDDAVHAAVCRGSYTIFEYILKEHHFEDLVKEDTNFLDLMFQTVVNTLDYGLNEIQDRVEILTALSDLNREMFNYTGILQATPLLISRVHIKLLKTLIECGANLFHLDGYKNTILHNAAKYLSPKDYYDLLQFIPKTTLKSLLQMRNKYGKTTLHAIVGSGQATSDILQLIQSNGVDINTSDDKGRTCVLHAFFMENLDMTIPTVKLLLENGLDHTRVDSDGNSILHESALRRRIDCLRFFLEEKNMNVNQINGKGDTPLLCALLVGYDKRTAEIIELLLSKGADYNISDKKGNHVLHRIAASANIKCLSHFTGLPSLDMNARNCNNDTPLHLVIKNIWNYRYHFDDFKSFFNTTEALLSLGADVNAKNNDGKTPFHLYIEPECTYLLMEEEGFNYLRVGKLLEGSGLENHLLKDYFSRKKLIKLFK